MSIRSTRHILLFLMVSAAVGCATMRFNVTVQDQMGQPIDHRILKTKDLPSLMDEMYSSLSQGNYEQCRGLAGIVKEVWLSEQEAISDASRLSAWATLFLYQEHPIGLTSLENEKRNLLILREASSEFSEAEGRWALEADAVIRAIDACLLNRSAFDAFVKVMKTSAEGSSISGNSRPEAIASITKAYPDWSTSVGLGRLMKYPWRQESQ